MKTYCFTLKELAHLTGKRSKVSVGVARTLDSRVPGATGENLLFHQLGKIWQFLLK